MTTGQAPRAQMNPKTQCSHRLLVGDVELDLDGLIVRVGGKRAVLTYREFLVLRFLMSHAGRVVEREAITRAAWDPEHSRKRNADIYIRRLRRHLGDHGEQLEQHIRTVRSAGYIFQVPSGPHVPS